MSRLNAKRGLKDFIVVKIDYEAGTIEKLGTLIETGSIERLRRKEESEQVVYHAIHPSDVDERIREARALMEGDHE